jgi:hypothetical protein
VSPVVAAAVCAAVLKAVGIDVHDDDDDDEREEGGHRLPYLPHGACARREVVRPCLRLLLSATPSSCRQQLERQCTGFLLATDGESGEADDNGDDDSLLASTNRANDADKDGDDGDGGHVGGGSGGCGNGGKDNAARRHRVTCAPSKAAAAHVQVQIPLAASGYGSSGFTARDAKLTTRLLQRSTSEAECIAGLTAVARAAHYPDIDVVDSEPVSVDLAEAAQSAPHAATSALTRALLDGGLLAAVVRQLTAPASNEAERLAVVTLINMCTVWDDGPSSTATTLYYTGLVRTALDADALAALQAMRTRAAAGTRSDLRFASQLDRLSKLMSDGGGGGGGGGGGSGGGDDYDDDGGGGDDDDNDNDNDNGNDNGNGNGNDNDNDVAATA